MQIALVKSYDQKPWRSPETYARIEKSLSEHWDVSSIHTNDADQLQAFFSARAFAGDDVFAVNIAEYLDENIKTGFLPALLDGWGIAHFGSGAEAIKIGLDKAATKRILEDRGIPTPRYFVAADSAWENVSALKRFGFPMIVKPVEEGGHKGISEDSIVHDVASLRKMIRRTIDQFGQPALVEEYITGEEMREFSVGIIDAKTRLFTPIEIDYASMKVNEEILSFETAQAGGERIKRVEDEDVREIIIDLANRTFDAVGAHDYSRVDLRMNQSGCYVLEINIMPGLGPNSFLPEAAKDLLGLDYEQLIRTLIGNSIRRHNVKGNRPAMFQG